MSKPRRVSLVVFVADRSASAAVMTSLMMAAVLGLTAITIDSGLAFNDKRRQQATTDLAALAAAGTPGSEAASIYRIATLNGYGPGDVADVTLGSYQSDPAVSPEKRFQPGGTGAVSAVQVTLRKRHDYVFGGLMNSLWGTSTSKADITTTSVAASRNVAAFAIGSGSSSLDAGIANSLLTALIGSDVNLTVDDYRALLSTNVDVVAFSQALAGRIAPVATYGDLTRANLALGAALSALTYVAASTPASPVLATLLACAGSQGASFKLGALVDYGPYATVAVGSPLPVKASVNAYTVLLSILAAARSGNSLNVAVKASLPGIVNAALTLTTNEPAAQSSLLGMGSVGMRLTTAQTRLRLSLQLIGLPPLSLLTVPIVVDVANGTALLSNVACSGSSGQSLAQLAATPGIAEAWIGALSDQDLASGASAPTPAAAPIANVLGLVTMSGYAHASLANTTATIVPFSATDIAQVTRKTVSTTDYLAPLMSSLVGNLQLTTTLIGFAPFSQSTLNSSVASVLSARLPVIDSLLASVLSTLGVSVGNATTWVSGEQCGRAVLVH